MKPFHDLDAIDRRILSLLQVDAGIGNADLAQRVGSSTASVWRRVKSLEAAGILGPAVRLLDPASVGCGVNILCNVRMRSQPLETRRTFEDFVRTRAEIMECYSMSGDWDYLLRIVARDVADYERFLMGVLLGHPSVGAASSHFALSQTKYTTNLPL